MLKRALIINNSPNPEKPRELFEANPPAAPDSFPDLKNRIQAAVMKSLNIENLRTGDRAAIERELNPYIENFLLAEAAPLSLGERARLVAEIFDELFGLGPLQPLLDDNSISDILVNDPQTVYIERRGKLQRVDISFRDADHLMQVITRIVSRVGRRIDEHSPMVDARLLDGSRVNAIIPPLALRGPSLSIRRFGRNPLTANNLTENRSCSPAMLELLKGIVRGRLNVLISGGTGSGKTTLLNILSGYIPSTERIITVEDAAELQLHQEHVVSLETRPPSVEGRGAISQRQLVVNALRMRPDRIVVGEVRAAEAMDMLQAMNTGHEGSMSTIHANSPRDALDRLETMVSMANVNVPESAIRQYMASAINVIVQVSRMSDGTRKIVNISELEGMEQDIIVMQDIFTFDKYGIGPNDSVVGVFRATGVKPSFYEKLRVSGIHIPLDLFEDEMEVC
ncbi:MAG: CpaF family protein [Acidobacteria bacterium]|nr:CpaF family protein [Acidobacteriota bacterium]MBI3655976.1 CpaF family protein [Acidobacteriota bacterium]